MAQYPTSDAENAVCACAASTGGHGGAPILAVEPFSPADDAGFTSGCRIVAVDGRPVRDIIDWRWLSADEEIVLSYIDADGDAGEVVLERDEGQDWGFCFDGLVYDGVRQCRNACTFCFMRQLPHGMRPSLSLRDDDYRLSFLAGTFVTLTNMRAEDEERIERLRISPLHVSLHAVDPQVRRALMGPHAQEGIESLERLLACGIECHTQIVLVPGVNDGAVLAHTLQWAYERPGIIDVCVVPLGFTDHQTRFDRSFNEPDAASVVLEQLAPFQERALRERGSAWVYAADEFYRNAFGSELLAELPAAAFYGDFAMFEDGVGLIRNFVDEWRVAAGDGTMDACARTLDAHSRQVRMVVGFAMEPFFDELIGASVLADRFAALPVRNRFFGGNVDVTGLLCACDIQEAIRADGPRADCLYALPAVIFNDDGLTLDGSSVEDMQNATGAALAVVSCSATGFLPELSATIRSQE